MIDIENKLQEIIRKGLLRELKRIENISHTEVIYGGSKYINFSSNNYLGLANDSRVVEKAKEGLELFGVGSRSSRLISGSLDAHVRLEAALADFRGMESALVFPTGYMTNLGLLSSLAGAEDALIVDRLNHASLIDGIRLSRARMFVYPHKDMDKLEKLLRRANKYKNRVVVTDSLFSMDGDIAPLKDIIELSSKYNARVLVDEAHATGIFGEKGRGIAEFLGVEKELELSMGTLSKAIGCQGGFVAGSKRLISYLINTSRTFIYTTGLAPSLCWACLEALRIICEEPERRKELLKKAEYLRKALKKEGFNTLGSASHIIPILIGDIKKTVLLSEKLLKFGIFIPPIRPPTVPEGESRLRISLSSAHSWEEINFLLESLKKSA
ncbi:MAG: 8-amino-7-oxononanoate synthase [bacterium]